MDLVLEGIICTTRLPQLGTNSPQGYGSEK